MIIQDLISTRGIKEVLHFTTNKGVLGVLDSRALKARDRLQKDERLEYIFQPNAKDRTKDAKWLDYVNLSISKINIDYFNASGSWHRTDNLWWCVLSFDPKILTHEGVYFTTTNNIYTGVLRQTGAQGLERMFAESIIRWNRNIVARPASTPHNWTTCNQAEVLYPGQVSTEYLKKIYVDNDQAADELAGQLHMLGHPEFPIEIRPTLFQLGI
jgi:hypothetical protein